MTDLFKDNKLLWNASSFCLAFCMLAVYDLAMLRGFGKWDGLWYYFCATEYLIVLDKIFILLSVLLFIYFFVMLWRKYRWYASLVFIMAVPYYVFLLVLHVLILHMVH